MIDWTARVDAVIALLAAEYRMDDREAAEILLASLVECPRTRSLWLVIETNWYSRYCEYAWFSFGQTWIPRSLAQIRARTPWREIEAMVTELLDQPEMERLFVEPDFERYPSYSRVSNALFILDRALRVRTIHRRAPAAAQLALDEREEERRADLVSAAVRSLVEVPAGARGDVPPRFQEPANFIYYAELVHRLSPWFRDWQTLVKALGLLAVRHAHLYGRKETSDDDYRVMARAAGDSVPPWIAKAIGMLLKQPARFTAIEKHMLLEEKKHRSGHGAYQELGRLRRNGLIQWNQQKMEWRLVEEHRAGLEAVLSGRAFGYERRDQTLAAS